MYGRKTLDSKPDVQHGLDRFRDYGIFICMPLSPESLYQQVGQLVRTMPDFEHEGPLTRDDHIWLGRLTALAKESGEIVDFATLTSTIDTLVVAARRTHGSHKIQSVAYRLLALAEINAPASAQGTFIPAGNAFDALNSVGKVLQAAAQEVLIVDPYMDEKALTTFAVLANEGIAIRLLTDSEHVYPSLLPASQAWVTQYGAQRPLEARKTPRRKLHDRDIIVDKRDAYSLGQSLKNFAERAPTAILRVDPETAALKVQAYDDLWANSSPV